MIVGRGMCYFSGMCIFYLLAICLDRGCVFVQWFLKYLPNLNLRDCVIWALVIQGYPIIDWPFHVYVCVGKSFVYIGYHIFCEGDECMHLCALYLVVFEVADWAVVLCKCPGDRWPIWCPMGDEVERGFNNAGLFNCLYCLANLLALLFPTMFVWALTLQIGDIVVGGF